MNPYQYPLSCDVCGGVGVGTSRAAAAAWAPGGLVSHRDPRICADNLAVVKRRDAEREAERNRWAVPA